MKKLSRNIFFEPVAVENKWHGADWSNFQLVELQITWKAIEQPNLLKQQDPLWPVAQRVIFSVEEKLVLDQKSLRLNDKYVFLSN